MLAQNAFSYPGIGISGLEIRRKKIRRSLKLVGPCIRRTSHFSSLMGKRMAAQRTNLKIKIRAHVMRAKLLFSSFLTMKICEVLVNRRFSGCRAHLPNQKMTRILAHAHNSKIDFFINYEKTALQFFFLLCKDVLW